MEFWGVEVPSGKSLTCDPGEESYVHVSQAALGESKSVKGNDKVVLKVKVGNVEVVVGTLSQGRCDQTPLDLIFDKEFVLSHSGTGSSVYFCGYKTDAVKDDMLDDEEDISDSEEDVPEPVQVSAKENGKPGLKPVKSETLATKPLAKAPVQKVDAPPVAQASKAKPQIKDAKIDDEAEEDEDEDEDDDDDEEDEDDEEDDEDEDDEMLEDASDDDDDLESDEDDLGGDDSEEEQPKSAGKKRPSDTPKNIGSEKKAKITTPMGPGKPGGKMDTKSPTPALTPKQQQRNEKKELSAKKTPGKENSSKGGTPASGKKLGQFFCQPCSKNFQSESALEQHNSAKHK